MKNKWAEGDSETRDIEQFRVSQQSRQEEGGSRTSCLAHVTVCDWQMCPVLYYVHFKNSSFPVAFQWRMRSSWSEQIVCLSLISSLEVCSFSSIQEPHEFSLSNVILMDKQIRWIKRFRYHHGKLILLCSPWKATLYETIVGLLASFFPQVSSFEEVIYFLADGYCQQHSSAEE